LKSIEGHFVVAHVVVGVVVVVGHVIVGVGVVVGHTEHGID